MLVHAAHLRMSLLNRSFSDFAARHLHDGLLLPVVMLERVPAVLLRIGEAHDLLLGGRLDGVGGEQHGCADAQAALRELGAAAGMPGPSGRMLKMRKYSSPCFWMSCVPAALQESAAARAAAARRRFIVSPDVDGPLRLSI